MSKFLYYNTLLMVTTDGKQVWTDNQCSQGFVPKGRAAIHFKLNNKVFSKKQLFDFRFVVRLPIKRDLPDWAYEKKIKI